MRATRLSACTLFAVDASGSWLRSAAWLPQGRRRRAAHARLPAAQRGRLIAFRGRSAELVLPPTNRLDQAYACLRDLPTGGRTPLAAALQLALGTLTRFRREQSKLLVLVTDGRANVGLSGGDPDHDVQMAAQALRQSEVRALVVDSEDGLLRLGLARRVAELLGGHYVRLANSRSIGLYGLASLSSMIARPPRHGSRWSSPATVRARQPPPSASRPRRRNRMRVFFLQFHQRPVENGRARDPAQPARR